VNGFVMVLSTPAFEGLYIILEIYTILESVSSVSMHAASLPKAQCVNSHVAYLFSVSFGSRVKSSRSDRRRLAEKSCEEFRKDGNNSPTFHS
jgi:hypothetical protein